MGEHLHSFNFDTRSDTMVSLLPSSIQPQTQKESTITTTQLSSLPGIINTPTNQGSNLVGPSAKELESFKELIQFDHVYFKPQPKGKIDSVGQAKVISNVLQNSNNLSSAQQQTVNNLKNVKIIITSDVQNIQNSVPDVKNDLPEVFETGKDFMDITELDSDTLGELNFDLLEDLENILKADTEGLTFCSDGNNVPTQNSDTNGLTESGNNSRGLKRKADDEIKSIVDTLIEDVPNSKLSVSTDSDYMSDVPSPYNAPSPYSSTVTGSPSSDVSVSSPLSESVWEESFTELFPDLM